MISRWKRFFKSRSDPGGVRIFHTDPLGKDFLDDLNDRQGKIQGFDRSAYAASSILMIGAGGLGTQILHSLIRKGPGRLYVMDDDVVEVSNLTRQRFYPSDLGKNKAIQTGGHIAREGFFPSEIIALPMRFQEATELGFDFSDVDCILGGVDNNPTRVAYTEHALAHDIPVIHMAVSRDGNSLYVAVQEPGQACFGCMFPHSVNDESYPCQLPGIIDVLQVAAGLAVFALDSILCGRNREWNLKSISLDGSLPDSSLMIARNPNCPLCQHITRKEETNGAHTSHPAG